MVDLIGIDNSATLNHSSMIHHKNKTDSSKHEPSLNMWQKKQKLNKVKILKVNACKDVCFIITNLVNSMIILM